MARIKCFFLQDTGELRYSLRRYVSGSTCDCVNGKGYHDAMVHLCDGGDPGRPDKSDPRWPTKCDKCEYVFQDGDERQLFQERIYRSNEGALMTLRAAPPGAMWYADWYGEIKNLFHCGPDGHCLVVKTPGGDWVVDSRASNCTRPEDNQHQCWVRHGVAPDITVDKNGDTCNAGAGSILIGGYHGFLRGGYLED